MSITLREGARRRGEEDMELMRRPRKRILVGSMDNGGNVCGMVDDVVGVSSGDDAVEDV
jgi:hypothetical protein